MSAKSADFVGKVAKIREQMRQELEHEEITMCERYMTVSGQDSLPLVLTAGKTGVLIQALMS